MLSVTILLIKERVNFVIFEITNVVSVSCGYKIQYNCGV